VVPDLREKPAVEPDPATSAAAPLEYVRTQGLGRTRRFFAWLDRHRRLLIVPAVTIASAWLSVSIPADRTRRAEFCRVCGARQSVDTARVAWIPYRSRTSQTVGPSDVYRRDARKRLPKLAKKFMS
jgi:hypothetical protein